MRQNNSPWLTQLHALRPMKSLANNIITDVVIIGGGIAGMVTAYFLLTQTDKKIILLEGGKIGHGATGHNAGQVVAEFERNLKHIAQEFGMPMTLRGQEMVEHAWDLLENIIQETNMDIPFREFIGYSGHQTLETFLDELEIEAIKSQHGLLSFPVMVDRDCDWLEKIPTHLTQYCTSVDQVVIADLLKTVRNDYHAVVGARKATLNSALFTEKLALWCLEVFPNRFDLFEKTFVHGIDLSHDLVHVITDQSTTITNYVVLCTNGFDNFFIKNQQGLEIDNSFHHRIQGVVGYMTGYITNREIDPLANRYFDPLLNYNTIENGFGSKKYSDTYFYVTQRMFSSDDHQGYLFAIGGPENSLENREIYLKEFDVPVDQEQKAVAFAERNFDVASFEKRFFWHGLMGYTNTGLRIVGPDPKDSRLLYNLGCNGVGILPSIMGGKKIARHVAGEQVEKTIFDLQE
jgi:glycine/D-amino acid oxidase-like deaminating enzyme